MNRRWRAVQMAAFVVTAMMLFGTVAKAHPTTSGENYDCTLCAREAEEDKDQVEERRMWWSWWVQSFRLLWDDPVGDIPGDGLGDFPTGDGEHYARGEG